MTPERIAELYKKAAQTVSGQTQPTLTDLACNGALPTVLAVFHAMVTSGSEENLAVDAAPSPKPQGPKFIKAINSNREDFTDYLTEGKVYEALDRKFGKNFQDGVGVLVRQDDGNTDWYGESGWFVPAEEAPVADKAKRRDALLREALSLDDDLDDEEAMPDRLYCDLFDFLSRRPA